jgi:hypothetical protein
MKILSNVERQQQWPVTRQQGKWPFVIKRGVIGFGLVAATIVSLLKWYFDPVFRPEIVIPINFILYPLLGVWVGVMTWRSAEKQYAAMQRDGQAE